MSANKPDTSTKKAGRQRTSRAMTTPRVGIFLMQKDENHLFPYFIRYYGAAFGYEHIHVLDNGSDPQMAAALDHARSLGVSVRTQHDAPQDFEKKGKLLGMWINANQKNYDVCLPLDCDEFIALRRADGSYTCDAKDLLAFFAQLKPGAYTTSERLHNHLSDLERFVLSVGKPKLFFVKRRVKDLDVGFHKCAAPKKVTASALCHFEMHNKPFDVLQQHARNKLRLRVDVDNIDALDALEDYTGSGHHLIKYLQSGAEAAYLASMQGVDWIQTPALKHVFSTLGLGHPFYAKA